MKNVPELVGIVNLTPDSFSDGGEFLDPARAVEHGLRLIADGAQMLDLGAESTRPGSDGVASGIQLQRLLPVLTALRARTNIPIWPWKAQRRPTPSSRLPSIRS